LPTDLAKLLLKWFGSWCVIVFPLFNSVHLEFLQWQEIREEEGTVDLIARARVENLL
jgi:hypothetical protein